MIRLVTIIGDNFNYSMSWKEAIHYLGISYRDLVKAINEGTKVNNKFYVDWCVKEN